MSLTLAHSDDLVMIRGDAVRKIDKGALSAGVVTITVFWSDGCSGTRWDGMGLCSGVGWELDTCVAGRCGCGGGCGGWG